MRNKSLKNKGSLLIEVLISIALFLAISTIIAQAVYTSFYSERDSENKITLNDLLSQQIERVRAISDEHWNNIDGLSRGVDYYIGNKDTGYYVATGTYSGVVNSLKYIISFRLEDVYRDLSRNSTSSILVSTSTDITKTALDHSTIKIIAIGNIENREPTKMETYITRWRNIICSQKIWSATGTTGTLPCENTEIKVTEKNNIELGDQIKLCNGCK